MNTKFRMPNNANIQGLIMKGYTHPCSCHLLFTFSRGANTQAFFGDLFGKVRSAASWGKVKPESMLNIGLTFNGLKKVGAINSSDLQNFPSSFKNGPWSGGSQASLADNSDPNSTPSSWWNGKGDEVNQSLHCVVHAYGLTPDDLDTLVTTITQSATANGITEIIPLAGDKRLYQTTIDDDPHKIHFGYTDGISQPALQNPGKSGFYPTPEDNSNFLVGYYNGSVSQPGPFDKTSAGKFAKDGCYNAFRILYQDVATFDAFLKEQVQTFKSELSFLKLSDANLEEWFAAKLCGRWRNGSPMMTNPIQAGTDKEAVTHNENFGFAELGTIPETGPIPGKTTASDAVASSTSCPFSAHTRVANSRNQNLSASEGTGGVPRIIRRGVPYGEQLEANPTEENLNEDRGLIGLFLCGNLSGQFEKLYGWMNNNNFSDKEIFSIAHPPQDAMLGNRAVVGNSNYPGVVASFEIPLDNGTSITITELPQFLATRGTAYCFLPSIKSLAAIAGIKVPELED